MELVKDVDVMPADPGQNVPLSLLAARPQLLLNGRRWAHGAPVPRPSSTQQMLDASAGRMQVRGQMAPMRSSQAFAENARMIELQTLAEVQGSMLLKKNSLPPVLRA